MWLASSASTSTRPRASNDHQPREEPPDWLAVGLLAQARHGPLPRPAPGRRAQIRPRRRGRPGQGAAHRPARAPAAARRQRAGPGDRGTGPRPAGRGLGPHHRAQQAPLPPARILPWFLATFAGSNGDTRNMPATASRCSCVMAVPLLQVIVPGRAQCQPAGGTWRPLGVSLAPVRCRAAKPAPSRRGRMRGRPDRGSRNDPGPATGGSGNGVP